MAEKGELDNFFKNLFLIAAIYDFVLGLLFLFFYLPIYNFLNMTLPGYPAYLQMSAAFVVAMGVGYFFVYKNMYRNIDLVKLGIVYKAAYSGVASYFYFTGQAFLPFLWLAIIDTLFLLLFVWFLVYAKKDNRYIKWA